MKRIIASILVIFICLISIYSEGPVFQKSILAFYKSSEGQTEKDNEIYYYLNKTLKDLGFEIIYWDVDKGIPGSSITKYSRAVISWFRGPSMKRADIYLDFLDKMFDENKKVIILDNFGAYQDRDTQEYIQPLRLNATLTNLGIMYQGDWTEKKDILSFDKINRNMVEYQDKQDINKSSFFYRFLESDKDLKIHLSLKRSDRSYDPSPVIVTNKNGGFALSRYIYRTENKKTKLMLNLEKFVKEALFPKAFKQQIALIADPSGKDVKDALAYTEILLKRVKIPYVKILPKDFRGMVAYDLHPFTSVGLFLDSDSGIDVKVIDKYMEDGGGIVSFIGGKFDKMMPYLGIKENKKRVAETFGYKIDTDLILGDGISIEDKKYLWQPGPATPEDNVQILGTDQRDRNTLVWTGKYKKGRYISWNWNDFKSGEFLGLLLESLFYVQDTGTAAIPAISLMYMDDWPLPMYNVVKKPLDITDTEFYTKTWWPDMKKLLREKNMPFSSYLIFNYNAQTDPPFFTGEFFVGSNNSSVKIANEIIDNGWELGLHGYNHMSLTNKSSEINPHVWSNPESMKTALIKAKKEWVRLFGEAFLPRTYVAPHNVISQSGIELLHEIFPSIKAVCTLYAGSGDEDHFDYGPHPNIPGVYMLPRTASGYHFDNASKQYILSGITGPGIWSHFIHADDLFDPARSKGKSWPEMLNEFRTEIEFVDKNYPWLEKLTAYDGYRKMQKHDETGVIVKQINNLLILETTEEGTLFRIRLNDNTVQNISGGTIEYSYKNPKAIIVKSKDPVVRIKLK